MGWGKEEKEVEKEKKRMEKELVNSLPRVHNTESGLGRSLSGQLPLCPTFPSCSIFSLHPILYHCTLSSLPSRVGCPAFSQTRPTCPESQYTGDSLLTSLRVKESESQG